MQAASALTRRHVLGGLGGIITTTATGLGVVPAHALGPVTILELGGSSSGLSTAPPTNMSY